MLLDYIVRVFLVWKKLPNFLPKCQCHFALPPAEDESSSCSMSLPALGIFTVLNFDHCSRCEAIVWHSLTMFGVEHLFMYLFAPVHLWWGVYSSLLPIFKMDLFSYCWVFKFLVYFGEESFISVSPGYIFSQSVFCFLFLSSFCSLNVVTRWFLITLWLVSHSLDRAAVKSLTIHVVWIEQGSPLSFQHVVPSSLISSSWVFTTYETRGSMAVGRANSPET